MAEAEAHNIFKEILFISSLRSAQRSNICYMLQNNNPRLARSKRALPVNRGWEIYRASYSSFMKVFNSWR